MLKEPCIITMVLVAIANGEESFVGKPFAKKHKLMKDDTVSDVYGNSRYILKQSKKTFDDAQSFCAGKGGNLATVTSRDEHRYLWDFMKKYSNKNSAWIGLYEKSLGMQNLRWIDGSYFGYGDINHFQTWGDPHFNWQSRGCILMKYKQTGRWWNRACSNKYFSLCELKVPDVKSFGGHTYMMTGKKMTYIDAKKFCRKDGYELVTITSYDESKWLRQLLRGFYHDEDVWIGMYKSSLSGTSSLKWLDGTDFEYQDSRYYQNWWGNSPHQNSERCIVAVFDQNGKWTDRNCVDRYWGICKK